ncbi:MAG: Hpt domain-containing protein [Oscillospiraceae bacterium]|jgi:two-component system chemotaxis sensor kinase CheA|nr:Hpt domain-containing protein [Oscillospiraceae bacterium]
MMRELDPMLDVFIFETQQLLESLEETLLQSEKAKSLTEEHINEIFRVMHTIKGSSAMMAFDNLVKLSHALEDMFDKIREGKTRTDTDTVEGITELVLASGDKFKGEIEKLLSGAESDGDFSDLSEKIHKYTDSIMLTATASADDSKGSNNVSTVADTSAASAASVGEAEFADDDMPMYKIKVLFEPGCQMENLRAFTVTNTLLDHCRKMEHIPEDLEDSTVSEDIIANGFTIFIQSGENPDSIQKVVDGIMYVDSSNLIPLAADSEELPLSMRKIPVSDISSPDKPVEERPTDVVVKQNFISVNVNKLDKLMNLMGEIVTTESMVTKNPEVANLHIDSFERSSQELRKLISELQDIVLSIRMLPVSNSFQKMHRIVRDVSKKVGKEV